MNAREIEQCVKFMREELGKFNFSAHETMIIIDRLLFFMDNFLVKGEGKIAAITDELRKRNIKHHSFNKEKC